ncbi:hypothetical protein LB504_006293, partial [Fusarium proliferatum]
MRPTIFFSIISTVVAFSDLSSHPKNRLVLRQDEGEAVCANCDNSVTCNGVKVNCVGRREIVHLSERQEEEQIRNVCNNCKNNVVCRGQKI